MTDLSVFARFLWCLIWDFCRRCRRAVRRVLPSGRPRVLLGALSPSQLAFVSSIAISQHDRIADFSLFRQGCLFTRCRGTWLTRFLVYVVSGLSGLGCMRIRVHGAVAGGLSDFIRLCFGDPRAGLLGSGVWLGCGGMWYPLARGLCPLGKVGQVELLGTRQLNANQRSTI